MPLSSRLSNTGFFKKFLASSLVDCLILTFDLDPNKISDQKTPGSICFWPWTTISEGSVWFHWCWHFRFLKFGKQANRLMALEEESSNSSHRTLSSNWKLSTTCLVRAYFANFQMTLRPRTHSNAFENYVLNLLKSVLKKLLAILALKRTRESSHALDQGNSSRATSTFPSVDEITRWLPNWPL